MNMKWSLYMSSNQQNLTIGSIRLKSDYRIVKISLTIGLGSYPGTAWQWPRMCVIVKDHHRSESIWNTWIVCKNLRFGENNQHTLPTDGQLNLWYVCLEKKRRRRRFFCVWLLRWWMVYGWEGSARVRPLFSDDNGKVNALSLSPASATVRSIAQRLLLQSRTFHSIHDLFHLSFQMNFQSNLLPFQTLWIWIR